jgi:Stage II sporulation protein E (SpoIIE)
MLISKGGLRLLDSQNGILGWLPETAPTESVNEIELAPGDRLVFYTDGLVEVFVGFQRDEREGSPDSQYRGPDVLRDATDTHMTLRPFGYRQTPQQRPTNR